jgi:hypothetical protein
VEVVHYDAAWLLGDHVGDPAPRGKAKTSRNFSGIDRAGKGRVPSLFGDEDHLGVVRKHRERAEHESHRFGVLLRRGVE